MLAVISWYLVLRSRSLVLSQKIFAGLRTLLKKKVVPKILIYSYDFDQLLDFSFIHNPSNHDSEPSSECRQYLVLKLGGWYNRWWWGKAGCVVCGVWCKFALLAKI